jgi:hypothetical protein
MCEHDNSVSLAGFGTKLDCTIFDPSKMLSSLSRTTAWFIRYDLRRLPRRGIASPNQIQFSTTAQHLLVSI